MSSQSGLDDYRWLVGPEAVGWLQAAGEDRGALVKRTARLRKHLSAQRVHLVLEQVELRGRARAKFLRWEQMFFTRQGLEQATDQFVAEYKADRFEQGEPAGDLCCGIGGDLVALAGRGPAVGVDRQAVAALLAEANLRAYGRETSLQPAGRVSVGEADETPLDAWAAWHIDPDRRPEGRRTTRPALHQPGLPVLRKLIRANGNAAVKLAPAAEVPDDWSQAAELEWISRDRQCRQLVAWFGRLARQPGRRRATVLGTPAAGGRASVRTLVADAGGSLPVAAKIGRYVFDPDPAVLAAGLTATLGAEHALSALAAGVGYLTGDRAVDDPAAARFEVTDVLPLDVKRLRRLLADRGIGRLEIKKRGVALEPEQVRRRLKLRGPAEATLLIAPLAAGVTAILARR